MKLELIMAIVIPCIMIVGTVIIHLVEFFQKDDVTCKVWAEQWDDLDKKLKYSKLGLTYPPKEITYEDIRQMAIDDYTKQLNEEKAMVLDSIMRDCANKLSVSEVVGTMSDSDCAIIEEEEEPKSKKLEPLICKMCGGTVAKKGDNYECEYCGLRYEWR